MSVSRIDPFVNYNFRVEIDGIEVMAFKEVSGLSNKTDIYEFQEGGENQYTHKLVGQTTYENIVLKHGITHELDLIDWREQVINGSINEAKRSGTITLYKRDNTENKSWRFHNAWPCKWEAQPFDKG